MLGSPVIASAWYHDQHFGDCHSVQDSNQLKGKKLLVLWGGEDISPSIYGEVPVHTQASAKPSKRDAYEMELTKEAVRLGIPIIGVCRGAQLLCAMHGGALYQHVDNHGITHELKVGQHVILTNSAHHQMMIPDKDAEVLGTTVAAYSKRKWRQHPDEPVLDISPEPEIVWFPKFRALGIQGHPEWLSKDAPLNKVMRELFQQKTNLDCFAL